MEFLLTYQFSFWLQGKSAGLFLHKWKSCYILKGLGAGERCSRHSSDQQEAYNFLISWQRSYRYLHKYRNIHSCESESGCFLHFALWVPYLPHPTELDADFMHILKTSRWYIHVCLTQFLVFIQVKEVGLSYCLPSQKWENLILEATEYINNETQIWFQSLCSSTAYCDFLLNNVSI